MIERYFVIFFCLFLRCSAELPLCHMEDEQCNVEFYGNGGTNLLEALPLNNSAGCKEACTNTPDCRVFTHYGPGSSPYKEMCFLFSECLETSAAEDCVTESLEDCSCSLARECLVTPDNLYGMFGGVADEQLCRQICFDSSEIDVDTNSILSRCEFYNHYSTSHPSSPGLCVLMKSCDTLVALTTSSQGCRLGPRKCSLTGEECRFGNKILSIYGCTMYIVKKRQCNINFQPGHVVHLQQGERDDEFEHGDEDDVRGAGVQPPGENAGCGGRRQLSPTQGRGGQWPGGVHCQCHGAG